MCIEVKNKSVAEALLRAKSSVIAENDKKEREKDTTKFASFRRKGRSRSDYRSSENRSGQIRMNLGFGAR